MKYIISKIVGNDTIYVKSYRRTGRLGKYRVEYTPYPEEAMDFETNNVAKLWAANFTYSDHKEYHIETVQATTEEMDKSGIRKGEAIILALIAALIFASCTPKIQQYQVTKVNGKKFKVAGHKGTFISPKDSIINPGQWVPIKH